MPIRLVAIDGHEVAAGRNVTVHVCGRHFNRTLRGKAAGRFLHEGKRLGHDLFQNLLEPLVHLQFQRVHLLKQFLLLVQLRQWEFSRLGLKRLDLVQFPGHVVLDALAQLNRLGTQTIGIQPRQRRLDFLHPIDHRLDLFDVVGRLVSDECFEKLC